MERIVYIVHCIDAEGPLSESLEATFQRLREIFNIEMKPTRENLVRLQHKEIDLKGLEGDIAKVVEPALLNYNDTWEKINDMLYTIMSKEYREKLLDSFGGGWIYNWHCVDHIGYEYNPRKREIGYHKIFDYYREMIKKTKSFQDSIHFHYHPMSFDKNASHCATNYFYHTFTLFQVVSRRIIEKNWFPAVNRAGFHTIRPDSHWFFEQYVPFDFSNQATDEDYESQKDISQGRFGDWRRAPKNWQPYHPAYDDYQVNGNCRRWIARCMNIGTRLRILRQQDVDQAFQEAEESRPVVLSFTNHDFRDMRPDIEQIRTMISESTRKFPKVKYCFCEARQAMRSALNIPHKKPCVFKLAIDQNRLDIISDSPTFGPQPYLALKTKSGEFYHDNLDIHQPFFKWSYVFDKHTFSLESLEAVGIGTSDAAGNTTTAVIDINTRRVKVTYQ